MSNNYLHKFNEFVNLSSEIVQTQTVNNMVSIAQPLIIKVLADIHNNTESFPFEKYTFNKDFKSGLTNLCGLYLIVNKDSKKIYLGSSTNLALRKADYKRNFCNAKRLLKVYESMREDLKNSNSFYFIPLLVFKPSQVCFNHITNSENLNQIKTFFDLHLEKALLNFFLDEKSSYKTLFYNKKNIGIFQQGNTYGGSLKSGQASPKGKPLSFKDLYAWDSVSAVANSLLIDRRSVRNLRNAGKLVEISISEFNLFTGTKITNSDAESYFRKPENHKKLQYLRGSNGLNLRSNKQYEQFLAQFNLGNGES